MKILFLITFIFFNILKAQTFTDEIITKKGDKHKVSILKIKGKMIEFEILNSKGKSFIVETLFDSLEEVNSYKNGLKISIWKYKAPKIVAKLKIEKKESEAEISKIDSLLIMQLENDSINVGNLRTPPILLERFYRIDNKPVILREFEPIYPLTAYDKNYADTVKIKIWINRFGEREIIEVEKFTNDEMIQPIVDAVQKWNFTSAVVENQIIGVWAELYFILQSSKPISDFEIKIDSSKLIVEDLNVDQFESDSINVGDLSRPISDVNLQIEKKPIVLKSVSPKYPKSMYDRRISALTKLKVWISRDGIAEKIEIIETDNPLMLNSVQNAIFNWRFSPAQSKGKSVGVWAEVYFELRFE
ncbi:MAG: energy transducer TonB [Bacteroidota bacterium]